MEYTKTSRDEIDNLEQDCSISIAGDTAVPIRYGVYHDFKG